MGTVPMQAALLQTLVVAAVLEPVNPGCVTAPAQGLLPFCWEISLLRSSLSHGNPLMFWKIYVQS